VHRLRQGESRKGNQMRTKIWKWIRRQFENQMPGSTAMENKIDFGMGMARPGSGFVKMPEPVVVPAPPKVEPVYAAAPVAAQSIVAKVASDVPRCPNCGQTLQPNIAIVEVDPNNPDQRPIDWAEESRTDLPMRTSGRIQFLLRHETEFQRDARILNDGQRYRNSRAGQL
jgi:hypothetical protein